MGSMEPNPIELDEADRRVAAYILSGQMQADIEWSRLFDAE